MQPCVQSMTVVGYSGSVSPRGAAVDPERAAGEAARGLVRRRIVDGDEHAVLRRRARAPERVGPERRATVAPAPLVEAAAVGRRLEPPAARRAGRARARASARSPSPRRLPRGRGTARRRARPCLRARPRRRAHPRWRKPPTGESPAPASDRPLTRTRPTFEKAISCQERCHHPDPGRLRARRGGQTEGENAGSSRSGTAPQPTPRHSAPHRRHRSTARRCSAWSGRGWCSGASRSIGDRPPAQRRLQRDRRGQPRARCLRPHPWRHAHHPDGVHPAAVRGAGRRSW